MKILGMGLPELLIIGIPILIVVLVVVLVRRGDKKKKTTNNPASPLASNTQSPASNYPEPPQAESQQGNSQPMHPLQISTSSPSESITCSNEATDTAQASVLNTWKTSVGFSFLGVFVGVPIMMMLMILVSVPISLGLASLIGASGDLANAITTALVTPVAAIIFYVVSIIYATKFYPSYFTDKPKIKSNKLISFLNLTFGSFIFGVLWNGNLTKKAKGYSHTVFMALTALMVVYMTFAMGSTIAQGISYNKTSTNAAVSTTPPAQKDSANSGSTTDFTSNKYGFSVAFPSEPEESYSTNGNTETVSFISSTDSMLAIVGTYEVNDISIEKQAYLHSVLDGFLRVQDVDISTVDILYGELQGHSSATSEYKTEDIAGYVTIVLKGDQLYTIAAISESLEVSKNFVSSFRLL